MRNCFRATKIRSLTAATIGALLFGFAASSADAQSTAPQPLIVAAPTDTPAAKSKPARSTYKPYFVEFRARSAATYGHMYVLYGRVNGSGEIVKSDIAGLHPAGDKADCVNCSVVTWTLGHLLFVPAETGASDGDLEEKYVSARYRVMVDAATFKKVSADIAKLKADSPTWNALWQNCVSFGNTIAGSLGLKTPGFVWMEPKAYVDTLRELNGGKPQGPLKFAAASAAKTPAAAPSDSGAAETAPAPRKPKKQPVANLRSESSAVDTSR